MSLRFLLRRRIPIYNAGYNAMRTNPLTGARFFHEAQDYRASYEPVYMPEDGTVTNKWSALGGYGQEIVLREYVFTIWHLSKRYKTGQVKEGDWIATTGNTGLLTSGAHLHLEAVYRITNDKIDPQSIQWDEEREFEIMLIQPEGRPEISSVSPKKIRHPMSGRAWTEYYDSAEPVIVSQGYYDSLPTGKPIFFNANFGGKDPENIWEAEPAE